MPPLQNQINNGGLSLEFVTVAMAQGNSATNVDRDVLVKFKQAWRFIMVASMTGQFAASNIFMHFNPLYLPVNNGSATITPTGAENWLPLANTANSTGRAEGRFVRFRCPVQQFFIDVDHSATSANPFLITFVGSESIDDIISERL